jgi:hypothetical protein
MAAPKGRSYTPTRGPLAGQTFNAPANARGETAAYNAYQNALARHYGSPTYSALKTQRENPAYQVVLQRGLAHGAGRSEAHRVARQLAGNDRIPIHQQPGTFHRTDTGRRMRDIIKGLYEQGWYDAGEDIEDDFY